MKQTHFLHGTVTRYLEKQGKIRRRQALLEYSLSRVILLIAAIDALVVTAVLVVEIVLATAGATGATGWMMGRRDLRRDHRRKGRRCRYPAMRRQCWDCWITQEAVRFIHILPVHHISFEIVHRIHDVGT